MEENPSAVITKFNFCGLFKQACLRAITPEIVIGGFRKAGVYPYDPTRVSALKHSGSSGDKSSSTDTGDPSSDESSSGEDPLRSSLLVDGDENGDGSDPHGESIIYAMVLVVRMLVILLVTVVAHPQEKKIFTSRDLRRVMTCLIRIISCGSNNITQKLY